MSFFVWLAQDKRRYFFFFQAEDGIRDLTVTGVQTCALPIFSGHVTTDGDRLVLPVRAVDGGLEQPENGGMQRVVQMGHVFVLPVRRECVLEEIVRSDAEEARALRRWSVLSAALGVSIITPMRTPPSN